MGRQDWVLVSHLLSERMYDADTALVSPVLVLLQWSFVGLYCLKWLVEHLLRLTRCMCSGETVQ